MKRKPSRLVIIQNISCIYKKNVKYEKNQTNLLFLWRTGVEASKVITNSLKKDFGTPILFIPLTAIMSYLTCNYLTRLGNKKKHKKNKIAKLKSFFFNFGKRLFSKSWKPSAIY